jgi:hypothetical protein
MVHSIPPLLSSSYHIHSSWGRSLMLSLYLSIFSSNSSSMRWMRSAQAELGVHSASVASASPVILMLNGRLGRAWFLECTNVSFWEFFSLIRTSQTLVLKGSLFGEAGMPREVKKEGCTSECISPLFPPGVASHFGVWKGDWSASCLGEASLGMCLLFP